MPLKATVTPLSLYMLDETLFDGLQLPTMPTNPTDYPDLYVQGFNLDREVLVNNILMETGELDCIYPDPDFCKWAITQWSKKELPVWQELYNTLFYKYNPLWNKDGSIKETAQDLTSRDSVGSRSRQDTNRERAEDQHDDTDIESRSENRSSSAAAKISDARTTDLSGVESRSGDNQNSNSGTNNSHVIGSNDSVSTADETGAEHTFTQNGGIVHTDNDTENSVSAYNESTYRNRDKSVNDVDVEDNSHISVDGTDNKSSSATQTESKDEQTIGSSSGAERSLSDDTTVRTDSSNEAGSSERTETGGDSVDHSGTISRSGGSSRAGSGETDSSESSVDSESGTLDHTLTRTEAGNIGVTMTTQLIAAQRELVQLNFYDLITERFKERFCLLVY